MAYAAEVDPLCYPGSTVLRNLLNITDADLLDEVETTLFLSRISEPFPVGSFDVQHYLEVHRHLFQDVYSWAGEIRTIRIGKSGNWFCYPEHIETQMQRVFAGLGDIDSLHGMTVGEFSRHAAHFLAELNAVHPFREGNGRTQLVFLAMLAKRAGFSFDEAKLNRNRVMTAMIDSFAGDESLLVPLVRDIIS